MHLLLAIVFSFCGSSTGFGIGGQAFDYKQDTTIHPGLFIKDEDAGRILGQPAKLTERSYKSKDSVFESKCTYTAISADPATHQTGHLYWLAQQFPSAEAAHQVYAEILKSNQGMAGIETISNMGEEAWFQTDKNNFQFIMFRKKNMIIRMKVNKVTSFTSPDQLKKIASGLAASI